MITEPKSKRKNAALEFEEGRSYWIQYVILNGYAFEPTESGLKRLSHDLDVSIPHLRHMIHMFLSA